MAANFLEQLVSEWYEYQGYFVRRNVKVGRRKRGGYDCELDIVAYHPGKQQLVHVEPSMDGNSWETRERRFRKKFEAGKKHIPELFPGCAIPEQIDQIALFGFGSARDHRNLGSGRVMLVSELLLDILKKLKPLTIASHAVPENLPILRTLQFVSVYRKLVAEMWKS